MNKIKCKICGTEFLPNKENRYTANGGKDAFLFDTKEYDCFDCIECGCQIVVGARYARQYPKYLNINSDEYELPFAKLIGGKEEC